MSASTATASLQVPCAKHSLPGSRAPVRAAPRRAIGLGITSGLAVRLQPISQRGRAFEAGSASLGRRKPVLARRVRHMVMAGGAVEAMPVREGEPSKIQDSLAGLTTAFSLLSKAIAVSAMVGVNPLVGIWSSVVMGTSAPLLGSRPGIINGSAAVVCVPLAALVAVNGVQYIAPVIIIASVIEFIFGACKLAKLTALVSDGVMAGFLNALGVLLLESQIKVFTKAPGGMYAPLAMAALCIAIDRGLPKITKAIPSSLAGLGIATGVGLALNLPLQNLAAIAGADTFTGGLSSLPSLIDFGALAAMLTSVEVLKIAMPCAISIAFISILETLLAGRVVDEMTGDSICAFNKDGEIVCFVGDDSEKAQEQESLTELDVPTKSVLGMAVGKFISALLGGFGGCGLIPQTVLNVKSGGGGPLSSAAYAGSMAAFVLFLAPLVGQISLASLAGIMILVSLDTIQWDATKGAVLGAFPGKEQKNPGARSELVALLVTFGLCYKVDMAVGIVTGVVVEQALKRLGSFNKAKVA